MDRQLNESKKEIEKKLGFECEFFCYPNGSLDEYILERVRSIGYLAAVTTVHGLNCVGDDLHTLKRYPLPLFSDPQERLLRLSGILESRLIKKLLGKT